jgi:hypothetical protein
MFSDFFPENITVYEIMSKHKVEPERTHKICRLHILNRVSKYAQARFPARTLPTHLQTHTRADF